MAAFDAEKAAGGAAALANVTMVDNGDGTVTVTTTDPTLTVAGTAALGLVTADSTVVPGVPEVGIANLTITTAADAASAMDAIDSALTVVNIGRGTLGAVQSRFESAISNIQITAENLTAARGRIVDADFAMETANLSRATILQQAGTAMVAQANHLPEQVLQLLRG